MSATLKRCRQCGKVFNSFGGNYCADCTLEREEIFDKVQDYIYDHEDAGIVEISKALEIDTQIVLDFVKDGSLVLSEGHYALQCERCRKPIPSGRYCDECKNALSNVFSNLSNQRQEKKEPEKPKGVRMHIRHDK